MHRKWVLAILGSCKLIKSVIKARLHDQWVFAMSVRHPCSNMAQNKAFTLKTNISQLWAIAGSVLFLSHQGDMAGIWATPSVSRSKNVATHGSTIVLLRVMKKRRSEIKKYRDRDLQHPWNESCNFKPYQESDKTTWNFTICVLSGMRTTPVLPHAGFPLLHQPFHWNGNVNPIWRICTKPFTRNKPVPAWLINPPNSTMTQLSIKLKRYCLHWVLSCLMAFAYNVLDTRGARQRA